jgi:hypothetical protein
MDGDLKNIQTNLLSVSTTMNMVSKFSTELENQVKAQSIVLQKLMAQNDSLRKTSIGKVEEKTVTVPKNEADSIIYAVQQYYAAKKWQNRLPFVLNKEKVEPLMEEAYQNNFRSYEIDKQSINIPGSRYVLGKTFKIFVDGEIVYIRKTNEGFKLDWEATKGYNAIDPSVVCAEKTNTATKLRAEVSLNDFYWIDYEVSKKSHLSLQISGCIGSSWISLSNAKIAELKKILSDGKSHQLIIEGAYKNFTSDAGFSSEFFIVSKLIKEGWDE